MKYVIIASLLFLTACADKKAHDHCVSTVTKLIDYTTLGPVLKNRLKLSVDYMCTDNDDNAVKTFNVLKSHLNIEIRKLLYLILYVNPRYTITD